MVWMAGVPLHVITAVRPLKAYRPMLVTLAGIAIDVSAERPSNAYSLMPVTGLPSYSAGMYISAPSAVPIPEQV